MSDISVPTGKYQSVAIEKAIPRNRAQEASVQNAITKTIHATPNKTHTGPILKTSTPVEEINDAHGPGFSGPMYLPRAMTWIPSISIQRPFNSDNPMTKYFIERTDA